MVPQLAKTAVWLLLTVCCATLLHYSLDAHTLASFRIPSVYAGTIYCTAKASAVLLNGGLGILFVLSTLSTRRSRALACVTALLLTYNSVFTDRMCPLTALASAAPPAPRLAAASLGAAGRCTVIEDRTSGTLYLRCGHAVLAARGGSGEVCEELLPHIPRGVLTAAEALRGAGLGRALVLGPAPTLVEMLHSRGWETTVVGLDAAVRPLLAELSPEDYAASSAATHVDVLAESTLVKLAAQTAPGTAL